ncbi:Hint domain-containing protein [Pseudogemmobacter sp. W21_MBD1_M6]|uniref:Hint domain-containing protein n=1 Tax=Pseudogemmobacter sp. W21_MBD1_M6 TaxID=3240271 RepID=UPI003F949996
MVAASKLPINTNASAMQMAETIFGDGVTVTGASYSGANGSSGIYTNGDTVSPGVTPGDTGVIFSTGNATDFTNNAGTTGWGNNKTPTQSNQSASTSTNTSTSNNAPLDAGAQAQFNAAAGTTAYDISYLDVDFIPVGDTMTMQFVFSSEEYPEYVNSLYQDFVGVWINGTQVNLTVGNGDMDPGNLSSTTNQNLYIDNTSDQYNTEMDGFTVTMTLTIPVIPGQPNSIRIGIADVTDSNYDSNLLIAAGSVQTVLIATDDYGHLAMGQTRTLDVLENDINPGGGTLTITHINGIAVTVGSTVTLSTGQQITLGPDGILSMVSDGTDENFNFTYSVSNGTNTDTGYVIVDSVPCFVAGTLILTPDGEVPVETLRPGDLVMTHDDGAQPLRWIGQREVAAEGSFAPIRINANTFGIHRELLLSPLHRVMIRDSLAELLFGEDEVLVAAKDLVNDYSVRPVEGGTVTYVHILFDRHQVVFSEGLTTESFLPGPQTTKSFEQGIVDEICALFPEIDPETGRGYSPAVRRTLRGFEAQVLFRDQRAA